MPGLGGYEALYIIYSQTAVTAPVYPARGYAGPSGRLDVIARAMASARPGSLVAAVPAGPPRGEVTLLYDPRRCRLRGERHAMAEIARAYSGGGGCIEAVDWGFERLLHLARREYEVVLLDEEGRPGPRASRGVAYILGGHLDLPPPVESLARRVASRVESIGPKPYHTSHVISYLEWRRLYCRTA